jgi:hypothetical protein
MPNSPGSTAPLQDPTLRLQYMALMASEGVDLAFADQRPETWPSPFDDQGNFDPESARRLIRYLESVRRYTDWAAVGSEGRPIFLSRLGKVASQAGPYRGEGLAALQGVVDRKTHQLALKLRAAGIALPFPVYIGLYPTGQFNARVKPVDGGALVLINAGLMDLIFTVLKVNQASSGDEADPPLLQNPQASMALADAFNAYLFGDWSGKSYGLPSLDQRREHFLWTVLNTAELFVLAHELGHVACGHVRLPASPGGPASVTVTPAAELEADRFAVNLLTEGGGISADVAPLIGGGILTVLVVASALERLGRFLGLPQAAAGTHPALSERWEQLGPLLTSRMPGTEPLRGATTFAGWLLQQHLPEIAEWLSAVGQTVTRTNKWEYVSSLSTA